MLYKKIHVFLPFIVSIIVSNNNLCKSQPQYDDESLDMFPSTSNNHICDTSTINKLEFCKDIFENSKAEFCNNLSENNNKEPLVNDHIDNDNNDDENNRKYQFNVEGVYLYYKTFVHKFLAFINYAELIDQSNTDKNNQINLNVKIELSKHDLYKLYNFSKYETKIHNSSIQDVTDILKDMLVDIESYTPNSKMQILIESFEQYLGLSLKSVFTCVVMFTIPLSSIYILIKKKIITKFYINLRMFFAMLLIIVFVYSCIQNYFYLCQKKEILRRAHIASTIPEECLSDYNKKDDINQNAFNKFYNNIKRYFQYSPTSRKCLDYSEAIMIDSFIKVTPTEVITYTILESIRPIFMQTGEFINEFYTGLAKDLYFYQSLPLLVTITIIMVVIFIVSVLLCCCSEINILHIFTIKKHKNDKTNVLEIKDNVIKDLLRKIAMRMPEINELSIENNGDPIECLANNIHVYVENKITSETVKQKLVAIKSNNNVQLIEKDSAISVTNSISNNESNHSLRNSQHNVKTLSTIESISDNNSECEFIENINGKNINKSDKDDDQDDHDVYEDYVIEK